MEPRRAGRRSCRRVRHCGDGDLWNVGWKAGSRGGSDMIVERVHDDKHQVTAIPVVDVRIEDDVPVPASEFRKEMELYLGWVLVKMISKWTLFAMGGTSMRSVVTLIFMVLGGGALAAEPDCAKLLLPADVKAACGATVTVKYAQALPAPQQGCSVMLATSDGDSVRLELASQTPQMAKMLFDSGNAETQKDKKDVPALGDKAHQYHLTNIDVDKLDVLKGSHLLSVWSGKREKAQVCSYDQMHKLAKTVLGRLPK